MRILLVSPDAFAPIYRQAGDDSPPRLDELRLVNPRSAGLIEDVYDPEQEDTDEDARDAT